MTATTRAVLVPANAEGTAGQIPFRPESSDLAGEAAYVLLILVLLLAATAALLWLAKRKGWLARWLPSVTASTAPGLRVEQSLRLSSRTVLYQVSDAQDRYLVIESSALAKLTVLERASIASTHE